MTQINFKIPEKEKDFLLWYSEQHSEPISSIYRNATLESFREWKTSVLISEYQKGSIGFKQFCTLANLSFEEATLIFQKLDIEPPISSVIDDYTDEVRNHTKLDKFKRK
jgi:predicted HTH domain antitoxin